MIYDRFLCTVSEGHLRMSSFRLVLKDFSVKKLWGVWTRSFIVNTVVRRCKRDRGVREVLELFRQTILKPRRTFFISATAAFKISAEDREKPLPCDQSITDEELQALLTELEGVQKLAKSTLYCSRCGKRIVIEKKIPGVTYCLCKDPTMQDPSPDGWVPYMEAEDVIIWRKECKHGQGLYAYKVYGRYKDVNAQDFSAVQVDGAYRRTWDAAVAALTIVEQGANGLVDQAVLHWEVLWPPHGSVPSEQLFSAAGLIYDPLKNRLSGDKAAKLLFRLFANRDYVYIRRHKEFEVKSSNPLPIKVLEVPQDVERPSVHSNAKRKAVEEETREQQRQIDEGVGYDNKMFVIISRSCEHPDVPETKHAIRVNEYWSNMVVKSTHGPDKPGMEFVLIYYDEPAVGGLPSGVASWATGRAAPAYLDRMRKAAMEYAHWRQAQGHQELPDFKPFGQSKEEQFTTVEVLSQDAEVTEQDEDVSEQEMESSKEGPELENGEDTKRDQGTQTERDQSTQTDSEPCSIGDNEPAKRNEPSENTTKEYVKSEYAKDGKIETPLDNTPSKEETLPLGDNKPEEEDTNTSNAGSWWRYLYPFYYFV